MESRISKSTGVFINPSWFKPEKLVSCIVGKYAKKFMAQSVVTGVYSFFMDEVINAGKEGLNEMRKSKYFIPKPNGTTISQG